ncbi:polyamine-transporting ATPase 13A3 isoform X2 [Phlebotomus papatasi]|uniref:polyamine-transporting ATPase 13A3 isoform X2 n=1 Tax=Phlebotomus papatasi TaxID=29031 RepID=UPI0024837846|nr:polyamine-transporting ATPase 13A3 isoform X2 [Phlebotomus papatasi]
MCCDKIDLVRFLAGKKIFRLKKKSAMGAEDFNGKIYKIDGTREDTSDDTGCHFGVLNGGTEEEMSITGYRICRFRTAIYWCLVVLSAGILRLIMHWWQHWLLLATHTTCPLAHAHRVLVRELYQGKYVINFVCDIVTLTPQTAVNNQRQWSTYTAPGDLDILPLELSVPSGGGAYVQCDSIRFFRCKQLRYLWRPQLGAFVRLDGLEDGVSSVALHRHRGLNATEQRRRRLVYGPNEIDIPVKGVLTLLFLEVLNPFYVFQIFSVCLWFSYNYIWYAIVIVAMSVFGITMSVIQTRRNQKALMSTVGTTDWIGVCRDNGTSERLETRLLVPGDVLEVPPTGCHMQCDAVLLSGNAILDESSLTGESVPVTKTPVPCRRDLVFSAKEHARHMLFTGTKVIQTRYIGSERVLALVVNTGNSTVKGGLIRSILYPPPVDYKFERDSYQFVKLLGVIAAIGFLYTLVTKIVRGVSATKIAIESLDLITIAVPPALPAAMTVGRMNAQQRLKKKAIYCISPRSINVSGSIDCVCFDKTGTLTEEGLDMWGVVPADGSGTNLAAPLRDVSRLPPGHLLSGMVTCHSITVMCGELKGDPLDLKMFEATGWILEEANVEDHSKYDLLFPTVVRPQDGAEGEAIGIVRSFPFTSTLQRMSVVTRGLSDNHFTAYCKGSPEMIHTLCQQTSIPKDFHHKLDIFAQQGYRIIAVAFKPLDKKVSYARLQRLSRESVEQELTFLGFVILENRLKGDTTTVISSLMRANIRTVMVTGDNILTAVSVAKDCGMIPGHQSVIMVNVRWNSDSWELYYNLTNSSSSGGWRSGSQSGTNNCLPHDSIDSLYTADTCTTTHTTLTGQDVECGGVREDFDGDTMLPPELPSNNYRFAMTGKTWQVVRQYYPELIERFATRGVVFARMSPEQKQSLVVELQSLGYYVAMCGDGANDCGALKTAHTGISLSEAESSVASPFTSRLPTIACVLDVIREGRAALVTSFGIFKYMAAYSLVQFSSVLILYSIDSNLTDLQYLYIDLFIISIFAFFFGKTDAYAGDLVKQTPQNSLISISPLISLALHLIISIAFQVFAWYHLRAQPWFVPFNVTAQQSEFDHGCLENFTIFGISCFQYIILAFVFSKGAPYRRSIVTNYGFLTAMMANTIFSLIVVIWPPDGIAHLLELVIPPDINFRLTLVACGACHWLLAILVESVLVEMVIGGKLRMRWHKIDKSHRKYLMVEHFLRQTPSWPPLTVLAPFAGATPTSTGGGTAIESTPNSPTSYAQIGAHAAYDRSSCLLNLFPGQPPNNQLSTPS